jgi:hypothetical protein
MWIWRRLEKTNEEVLKEVKESKPFIKTMYNRNHCEEEEELDSERKRTIER